MVVRLKYKWSGFKVALVLLLNLAIVFNFSINSFHEIEFHQHSSEQICNNEIEKDACHRYLVHHEESSACNKTHKHLSEKNDDCFVCKFFKERNNATPPSHEAISFVIYAYETQFPLTGIDFNTQSLSLSFLRGPPVYTL